MKTNIKFETMNKSLFCYL